MNMCEDCHAKRDELLKEISELAAREGELYDNIVEAAKFLPESVREEMLVVSIAKAIAVRAAFVAHFCDAERTDEGHMPVPIILGLWAGWAVECEAEAEQQKNVERLFANLLGFGDN